MDDVAVDLFGRPVVVRVRGRGRPAHEWTEENSNKVKMMLALGWDNAKIAEQMGVSQPTLRKHYFAELKVRAIARDALTVRRLELLVAQLEAGSAGADRAIARLLEHNDRLLAAARERRIDEAPRAKPPARLGVKQEARERAREAVEADPFLNATLPGLPN